MPNLVTDDSPSSLAMWTTAASGLCVLASFVLFNAIYYNAMTNRLADWIGIVFASYCVVVVVGVSLVVVSWWRGGRIARICAVLLGIVLLTIPVQLLINGVGLLWERFLLG